MGVSTKELFKQIETGAIQSVDFLPDFANEVRTYVRETGMLEKSLRTSRVAMNRFVTDYKLNVANMFEGNDGGIDSGLTDFFSAGSSVFESFRPYMKGLGDLFGGVIEAATKTGLSLFQTTVEPFLLALREGDAEAERRRHERANEDSMLGDVQRAWDKGIVDLKLWATSALLAQEKANYYGAVAVDKRNERFSRFKTGDYLNDPSTLLSIASKPSTTATNNLTQDINITVDGAKDPDAVGKEVMDILFNYSKSGMATGR